jgi:Arc/MetJ-type ribon-helix-helix transcriptional regulator
MASRPDYHTASPVTLRLPADLREWVERQAQDDGRSRSAVIIEAVREKRAREAG